jgi:hypothetical protein
MAEEQRPSAEDRLRRQQEALAHELASIRLELVRLNSHRFVRQMNSPFWMLGATFTRGMALGLGTVFGATILVSVITYLLAQFDFIPILGQWAARIGEEIQKH